MKTEEEEEFLRLMRSLPDSEEMFKRMASATYNTYKNHLLSFGNEDVTYAAVVQYFMNLTRGDPDAIVAAVYHTPYKPPLQTLGDLK